MKLALSLILTLATTAPSFAYTPTEVREAVRVAGGPEKFLLSIAEMVSKMLPKTVDKETELLTVVAYDRTIHYAGRLPGRSKPDVKDVSALRSMAYNNSRTLVCSSPVSSILISEYGAKYKYSYYSREREFLFDFVLDKLACSK